MLKDVILRQKHERERLLALPYVERSQEAAAKKWLTSDLIKVIVGPRRAGESIFALRLLQNIPKPCSIRQTTANLWKISYLTN